METYFENRHIHDLAYLKEYYLHTIKTVPKDLILWLVLAAGCLVFLVVDLMAGNFIMSIVYVALAACACCGDSWESGCSCARAI